VENITMQFNRTVRAVATFLMSCGLGLASAGDLNPPAGPVAPTMKPLSDVEPRIAVNAQNTPGSATAVHVISQPGSYYLTGNVFGLNGRNGIAVTASGVTLDLNGFTVIGAPGALSGVLITTERVEVRNGVVREWPIHGVHFEQNISNTPGVLTGVTTRFNSGDGVRATRAVHVIDCVADHNNGSGFRLGNGSMIRRSTARTNGEEGIFATSALVEGCVSRNNTAAGIRVAGVGSRVLDCIAGNNNGVGILVGGDTSTVMRSTSHDNPGGGILANTNASGSLIAECTVNYNSQFGISVVSAQNVTIERCTVHLNQVAQILISSSGCVIQGNRMRLSGAATNGVSIPAGSNNLVVQNVVTKTTGAGAGYAISAGNVVGPIFTGVGTITTTNPWANFER